MVCILYHYYADKIFFEERPAPSGTHVPLMWMDLHPGAAIAITNSAAVAARAACAAVLRISEMDVAIRKHLCNAICPAFLKGRCVFAAACRAQHLQWDDLVREQICPMHVIGQCAETCRYKAGFLPLRHTTSGVTMRCKLCGSPK